MSKKHHHSFLAFFLLSIVSMLLFFSACDGVSRVSGHVRDIKGRPIQGAKVQFEDNGRANHDMSTDSNGYYQKQAIHAPSSNVILTLRVSKDGFKVYERKLTSGQARDHGTIDIVLEPDSSAITVPKQ